MYFPVGWPKLVDLSIVGQLELRQICCDRVKLLVAIIADDYLGIWFAKPLVPIVYHRRLESSLETYGSNRLLAWKPDSSMIAIATSMGNIILYLLDVAESANGIFNQIDSPMFNLRRDSPELFIKDAIPPLTLKPFGSISVYAPITSIACISLSKFMVATTTGRVFRLGWDGSEETDLIIDLKKPASGIRSQAASGDGGGDTSFYIACMEYSPLIGGFAITLNNGRTGFLSATDFNSDAKGLQVVWTSNLEDATCCSINHKFRLLAFGRENSQGVVYTFEDSTGGLEVSHNLVLNTENFSFLPGPVNDMKWTPDGCALVMSWRNGGFSLWSTFGTLLTCSFEWDYGLNADLGKNNPLMISSMDWSAEGCQLLMLRRNEKGDDSSNPGNITNGNRNSSFVTDVLQMDFVKSTLTVNPCMTSNFHILLQGDDKLYVNQGKNLEKIFYSSQFLPSGNKLSANGNENLEVGKSINFANMLSESKHWIVVQLPLAYASTNWPIRYTAIDSSGVHVAVAGRTGLAHYSILTCRWKLFGNETQEKDFVVTGGLLWWEDFIVMGCFSLVDLVNEIRIYPKEAKLDNQFVNKIRMDAPIMLINIFKNFLLVLLSDGKISTFRLRKLNSLCSDVAFMRVIDTRSLCIHPAYVVSLTMADIRNEVTKKPANFKQHEDHETLILNVSGRILMIQPEVDCSSIAPYMFTCLASSVECIWLSTSKKSHMKNSIWLYSGSYGMRLWLPVLPCDDNAQRTYRHTFMSKRIMLSFPLKVYPLVILFEDVIILGVESDTGLYTSDSRQHFSLPFCTLEKKSQIYLHKILRQLIRRNLGYTAWEIAKSCSHLPYFPHSLELLLHEVLEDEATSKDPIPDAMLPSVLEFIREFPVYLQTIVQCARKTEIALWPYLFATAGKPKELFQHCLSLNEFESAASYLVILQNLEPSAVSRQYATLLLDTALDNKKWELARDLVRFLKAIDPEDVESPRTSLVVNTKFAPCPTHPVNPNPEDMTLILGAIGRGRSFSTTITPTTSAHITESKDKNSNPVNATVPEDNTSKHPRKKTSLNTPRDKNTSPENFFIELILQRHARKLLQAKNLRDLGYMSASLDFHLVGWLAQESDRAAKIEDFVETLNQLHVNLSWPKPTVETTTKKVELDNVSGSYFANLGCFQLDMLDNNAKNHAADSGYSSLQTVENNFIYEKISRGLPYKNLISINEDDSTMNDREDFNNLRQFKEDSVYSDEVSVINEEDVKLMKAEHNECAEKEVNQKLEVQIRYLLQLFIEGNCLDYSLLLSIILLDAASVCRIANTVMRSGSIVECRQILQALKDIAEWSSQDCIGYSAFMIRLRPQIEILSQFINQKELNTQSESQIVKAKRNSSTFDIKSLESLKTDVTNLQLEENEEFLWKQNPSQFSNHITTDTKPSYINTENPSKTVNEDLNADEHSNGLCEIM